MTLGSLTLLINGIFVGAAYFWGAPSVESIIEAPKVAEILEESIKVVVDLPVEFTGFKSFEETPIFTLDFFLNVFLDAAFLVSIYIFITPGIPYLVYKSIGAEGVLAFLVKNFPLFLLRSLLASTTIGYAWLCLLHNVNPDFLFAAFQQMYSLPKDPSMESLQRLLFWARVFVLGTWGPTLVIYHLSSAVVKIWSAIRSFFGQF